MLEENHGYKISRKVEKITKGRIKLGPGTLNGVIKNLNKKGLIKLVNKDKESGKKVYIATDLEKNLISEIKMNSLRLFLNSIEGIQNILIK